MTCVLHGVLHGVLRGVLHGVGRRRVPFEAQLWLTREIAIGLQVHQIQAPPILLVGAAPKLGVERIILLRGCGDARVRAAAAHGVLHGALHGVLHGRRWVAGGGRRGARRVARCVARRGAVRGRGGGARVLRGVLRGVLQGAHRFKGWAQPTLLEALLALLLRPSFKRCLDRVQCAVHRPRAPRRGALGGHRLALPARLVDLGVEKGEGLVRLRARAVEVALRAELVG